MSFVNYKLFGSLAKQLEPQFTPFKLIYKSSGMKMPFIVFLSNVIGIPFFTFPVVLGSSLVIHLNILKLDIVRSLFASILLALIISISEFGVILYYPCLLYTSDAADE